MVSQREASQRLIGRIRAPIDRAESIARAAGIPRSGLVQFLFCGAPQNRKGIDSLAQLCREKLDADPFSGCLFIFRSRSGKSIRILAYDSQGFWLATKRLSKGRFKWWPTGAEPAKTLRAHQAQLLLVAGNPETDAAPVWRSVSS